METTAVAVLTPTYPGLEGEVELFEGYAHLLPAQHGWQQVADHALDWALRHAR
ncbi:hypothetical protein ABZU25_25015 [Micromonospora sp. NPDC005215]|uniref:hypothetical protein n=1 Tax=Micromonospora sp. NPDC005215 TaxID=3157024 RepID=UPI0033A37587